MIKCFDWINLEGFFLCCHRSDGLIGTFVKTRYSSILIHFYLALCSEWLIFPAWDGCQILPPDAQFVVWCRMSTPVAPVPVTVYACAGDQIGKVGGLVEAAAKPCCVVCWCCPASLPVLQCCPRLVYDLYPLALVGLLRSSLQHQFFSYSKNNIWRFSPGRF